MRTTSSALFPAPSPPAAARAAPLALALALALQPWLDPVAALANSAGAANAIGSLGAAGAANAGNTANATNAANAISATGGAASPAGGHDLPDGAATADTAAERSVKAAFLYKFLGYVDFPGGPLDPGAPYVVGVVGAEDVAAELSRLTSGRTVNNHAVVVRHMHGGDFAGGLHLLFIGAAEAAAEAALVKAAHLAGALSVTESATGIDAGAVINFLLVDQRVRFEVSLAAAERGKLKLSSRLLSVAYAVQKGGG